MVPFDIKKWASMFLAKCLPRLVLRSGTHNCLSHAENVQFGQLKQSLHFMYKCSSHSALKLSDKTW